jgi:anthranilate synthase component 1
MSKKYKFHTAHQKILADTLSPVSVYLKIRDQFPHSLLLESSDYDARANNFSYICCNPIATLRVAAGTIDYQFPDGSREKRALTTEDSVPTLIEAFAQQFEAKKFPFKFVTNGLFGFVAHEAVAHFDHLTLNPEKSNLELPEIYYAVYQNIIAISLFNHEAHLFSHSLDGQDNLEELIHIIKKNPTTVYSFKKEGEKSSNLTDDEFKDMVEKAKQHCYRGDVFQLVLSRRFSQGFSGDEFNVYRTLRSINPSPYLFFFDYGDFKIFGSSPEAQLVVEKGKAEIHPIAGTFKRTGKDEEDRAAAERLAADPKENSEHVMLVDLARNDLSRNGTKVVVEKNREIQFFSHVIHLVSKVTGYLKPKTPTYQVVADTFPAGTLSGAPKHMALQLIDRYENTARNAYGGALGYMDFEGNFNHCIIIRSFMSKNQQLHYQAGAGIVSKSVAENELQEVYNKLGALDKALTLAEKLQA